MIGLGLLLAISTSSDTLLVSPSWLADRLHDPAIVILHVSSSQHYDAGHIPGARWVDPMFFHAHEGADLPPPELMSRALADVGVTNTSRIIISGEPLYPAILFVALDYLGLGDRTSLLDGGFAAWKADGFNSSTEAPVPTKSVHVVAVKPRSDVVVDAAWIAERLGREDVQLLDARTPEEYAGTAKEWLPRTGHIPGARLLNWRDVTDESTGRLRSPATLTAMFTELGAARDDTVVTYCTVGMRASELYFVARLLGYQTRIYAGSMADWSPRAELPVAMGAHP